MTDIQWLVDILLNHKLPEAVKDKFISRIGEIEAQLANQRAQSLPPKMIYQNATGAPVITQAPSMQRIIDEMGNEAPTLKRPPLPLPPEKVDKETGRAMISTGKGTFGPRKF